MILRWSPIDAFTMVDQQWVNMAVSQNRGLFGWLITTNGPYWMIWGVAYFEKHPYWWFINLLIHRWISWLLHIDTGYRWFQEWFGGRWFLMAMMVAVLRPALLVAMNPRNQRSPSGVRPGIQPLGHVVLPSSAVVMVDHHSDQFYILWSLIDVYWRWLMLIHVDSCLMMFIDCWLTLFNIIFSSFFMTLHDSALFMIVRGRYQPSNQAQPRSAHPSWEWTASAWFPWRNQQDLTPAEGVKYVGIFYTTGLYLYFIIYF